MLHVIPIPAFTDNYIWLIINTDNQHAAVVDPGDATPVITYCEQNHITLCDILITHHHQDHTGGIAQLVQHFHPAVFGPALESITSCHYPLKEGDVITLKHLQDLKFKILDIPGHTRGHIGYIGNGWLFCGDTLFAGGCGRIFEGTAAQLYTSLEKLKQLDPATLIFCAHEYTLANLKFAQSVEPNNNALAQRLQREQKKRREHKPTLPSTLQDELQTNPFLRADSAEIRQTAQHYNGSPLPDIVQIFSTIRKMKDTF